MKHRAFYKALLSLMAQPVTHAMLQTAHSTFDSIHKNLSACS